MATGHLNPGYGETVSQFHRIKSLNRGCSPSLDLGQDLSLGEMNSLDNYKLEDIRRRAREVWLEKPRHETSYQDHFINKFSLVDELMPSRPTSSHRRHKPHPKMVFLTTRLHHCPGYHNPDTTIGKPTYQVDRSLGPEEQDARARLRSKYVGQISSVIRPYSGVQVHSVQAPVSRPHTVPSLHGYLKADGVEEHLMTDGYMGRPIDVVTRRQLDVSNYRHLDRYVHRSKRGDFLMHPQWPPTMVHHRLNGLSSVDIPYSLDRR